MHSDCSRVQRRKASASISCGPASSPASLVQHPHLRGDLALVIEGRLDSSASNAYSSANLFSYDPAYERLPQFLKASFQPTWQAPNFPAHQICYVGFQKVDSTIHLVRHRKSAEPINLKSLKLINNMLVGDVDWKRERSAPQLRSEPFDPNGQCWCTSGKCIQIFLYAKRVGFLGLPQIRCPIHHSLIVMSQSLPTAVPSHLPKVRPISPVLSQHQATNPCPIHHSLIVMSGS